MSARPQTKGRIRSLRKPESYNFLPANAYPANQFYSPFSSLFLSGVKIVDRIGHGTHHVRPFRRRAAPVSCYPNKHPLNILRALKQGPLCVHSPPKLISVFYFAFEYSKETVHVFKVPPQYRTCIFDAREPLRRKACPLPGNGIFITR